MSFKPITRDSFATATAQARFDRVAKFFAENPVQFASDDDGNRFFPVLRGIGEFFITLGELLDADLNDNNQFDINPTKVLDILDKKETGFITNGILGEPITVCYSTDSVDVDTLMPYEDASPRVGGGRHRSTAIATLLSLSGYSREEIGGVLIRVIPHIEHPMITEWNNGSRSMTTTESTALRVQRLGLDVLDVEGLINGLIAKQVTSSEAYRLIFRQLHAEVDANTRTATLKPDTLGDLGVKFSNAFTKKGKALAKYSKDFDFQAKLIQVAFDRLEVELKDVPQSANIKRDWAGALVDGMAEYAVTYMLNITKQAEEPVAKKSTSNRKPAAVVETAKEVIEEPTNEKGNISKVKSSGTRRGRQTKS